MTKIRVEEDLSSASSASEAESFVQNGIKYFIKEYI